MKNEIAFASCENCFKVAQILVEEDYVVLISREEDLRILNFVYSEHADRNDVVFMSQEDFDELQQEEQNDD